MKVIINVVGLRKRRTLLAKILIFERFLTIKESESDISE